MILGRKVMTNPGSMLKSKDVTLPTKVKSYGFSSSRVRVGPQKSLSTKELVLSNCSAEKTLKSPLDCKEINPVNPKRSQP